MTQPWKKTACILCECNCGLEVQMGGEGGRHFTRIRGDKAHPASHGYACEKPHRLDYYQNNPSRLTSPMRRRADGTFEPIGWDTAIAEVAEKFAAIRDAHGGDTIFYFGGGGQGNHLPGAFSAATRRALGSRYRSNALAQEKTGEFWVSGRMMGAAVRGDFEHCEVGVFIGKNPWQSHGIPRARVTLKEIAKDPQRAMIVIDPRRSETAALADIHLQVKPGTDAWLLAALGAILVEENLVDDAWLAAHANGHQAAIDALRTVPIADYCARAGISEPLARKAARTIGQASSVAVFEDLGIQMNRHSTLSSYLNKLLWVLTGNFGKKGAQYVPAPLVDITGSLDKIAGPEAQDKRSPVTGARIISGLIPCNAIADEILADHPKRYRAMLVDTANPAHSLADSVRTREALQALELLVVTDIAMTETAMLADYVLPTSTQYEKAEATFFNFEFPSNYFQLRHPVLTPPEGVLCEAEIHARLCEALGAYGEEDLAPLHKALEAGRAAFVPAFFGHVLTSPKLGPYASVILYRTLGPTLPEGLAQGAVLWGLAHQFAASYPDSVRRAGFEGPGFEAPERLFDAILGSPSGVIYSVDEFDENWKRVRTPDGKFQLAIAEMLDALGGLVDEEVSRDDAFPFVLSAGERRSFTANTILRDPAWRKKDAEGALRIGVDDAASLGVNDGERVRVTTKQGSVDVPIEVSAMMQSGHVSLPNGLGVDHRTSNNESVRTGIAPNELTATEDRDFLAGTPWHKHVRARVEALR